MGNGSVIRPGELQLMRAGRGVLHSEYNHSQTEAVHFLQIWILPDQLGLDPAYEQRQFSLPERTNALCLMASRDGRDGSVTIHQDVSLYASILEAGNSVTHEPGDNRLAFVQIVSGEVEVNGKVLTAGDGAQIANVGTVTISAATEAEFLLFDLAPVAIR